MPRVFDLIQPLDTRDTYPITDVIFQKGGLREVETVDAMHAISMARRRKGMIVFINSSAEFYSLTADNLENTSWQKIDFANNIENNITIKEMVIKQNENSVSNQEGEDLSINIDNLSILKLKNGTSIATLSDINHQDGKILFIQNLTNNSITIKNNFQNGNATIFPFLTGTNRDAILLKNSSIITQFSLDDMAWRIIGDVSTNPNFLDLLDTPNEYPQPEINNTVFLTVNPNQQSDDKVIFNNPIPVVSNVDQNLVIKNINGLRIRRFDSITGEIVFAKFEPTITMTMSSPINFDDSIDTIDNVSVINDNFIEDMKVNSITSLNYYKNNDENNLIEIIPNESLPTVADNNYSWTKNLTFNTITDLNTVFGLSPNNFTFVVTLVDNLNKIYEIKKTVVYTIPSFSFTIGSKTSDFRNKIISCVLTLNYGNVTNKNSNSSITSVTSNTPDNPTFNNFTDGMTTYTANGLNINAESVTKTNTLTDTKSFSFLTTCKYTRPMDIDADQNYHQITNNANLMVTFTYPIFSGTTLISKTSLIESEVIAFANEGNNLFPRSFTYAVGNDNVHWWFCVRKRYINSRTPIVTLTSGGFTLPTSIINSNEVDITTDGASETYVCYCILLQANNTYTVNISI